MVPLYVLVFQWTRGLMAKKFQFPSCIAFSSVLNISQPCRCMSFIFHFSENFYGLTEFSSFVILDACSSLSIRCFPEPGNCIASLFWSCLLPCVGQTLKFWIHEISLWYLSPSDLLNCDLPGSVPFPLNEHAHWNTGLASTIWTNTSAEEFWLPLPSKMKLGD